MREYVIRNGSMYSGTHYIYENVEEFRKEITSDKIKLFKWGEDDFREYATGDYVIAEDGYCKYYVFSLKRIIDYEFFEENKDIYLRDKLIY